MLMRKIKIVFIKVYNVMMILYQTIKRKKKNWASLISYKNTDKVKFLHHDTNLQTNTSTILTNNPIYMHIILQIGLLRSIIIQLFFIFFLSNGTQKHDKKHVSLRSINNKGK